MDSIATNMLTQPTNGEYMEAIFHTAVLKAVLDKTHEKMDEHRDKRPRTCE